MDSAAFEDIAEDFEFLDEWEDRYRYVIELGKKMPPLDSSLKIGPTKVNGCASQVWIVPRVEGNGPSAVVYFDGDSDAIIVRGLIAVLRTLFSGKTAAEILRTDALAELGRLGLDQHLSAQRSNGLRAMIARIRGIAETLAA
ncbi:MAG: SufE family protein [Paracoccaceae bacterium]